MSGPQTVSVGELRAQYLQGKAETERLTGFFVYLIYRPLSFLLTPPLVRLGLSANAATMLGLAAALAMPIGVVAWPAAGPYWLAATAFAFQVLDCVDGNIARLGRTNDAARLGRTNETAPLGPAEEADGSPAEAEARARALGQYLDSVTGKTYHILAHIGVALVAAREVDRIDTGLGLALGLASALAYLWGRESRTYAKLHFFGGDTRFSSPRFGLRQVAPSIRHLVPFALVILAPLSAVYLLALVLAALAAADLVFSQFAIFRRVIR